MSEQSPGGIELLTIDDYVIAGVSEFRFEVDRALGAEFRECVSKACARSTSLKSSFCCGSSDTVRIAATTPSCFERSGQWRSRRRKRFRLPSRGWRKKPPVHPIFWERSSTKDP